MWSRPSVRPAILLLSHETSLCRDAAKATLHKSVSSLLSRSHLLTLAVALTSPDALPIARPKIDAGLRLMSPPGSLHQREGAVQLAGGRSCESRRCYFPCDVRQSCKLLLLRCCKGLIHICEDAVGRLAGFAVPAAASMLTC